MPFPSSQIPLARFPTTFRLHSFAGGYGRGQKNETPKSLPPSVRNRVIGNNRDAIAAASRFAETLSYKVINLGSAVEGETTEVAKMAAESLREMAGKAGCLLIGGETTVTLPADHGKGGRNTEFVLATLLALQSSGLRNYVVLSGGTDGEDGATDAAGAIGDDTTLPAPDALGLTPADFLNRHDSYSFFDATGDLMSTGLTQTNVMDIRVLLIGQQ